MSIERNLVAKLGMLVVAGSFGASAFGDQLTLGYGPTFTSSGTGGGEFAVSAVTGGGAVGAAANYVNGVTAFNGNFETFCLEYNEHFSPGSPYYYQISPGAIKGGTATSDPVSVGTAYLYGLFAKGQLSGYSYALNTSRETSAANLQNTFWFLEGERTSLPGGPLIADPGTFDNLLISEFGSIANAMSDNAVSTDYGLVNAASFGVAALNLGTTPNGDNGTWAAQDQLIYQGGGFSPVPEAGATLLLLSASFGGLAWLRRRIG